MVWYTIQNTLIICKKATVIPDRTELLLLNLAILIFLFIKMQFSICTNFCCDGIRDYNSKSILTFVLFLFFLSFSFFSECKKTSIKM